MVVLEMEDVSTAFVMGKWGVVGFVCEEENLRIWTQLGNKEAVQRGSLL